MAALYDNKIDAICLNEKYRDILHEVMDILIFKRILE